MSTAPAKVAVELFLNAKVFADHFLRLKGSSWTATPSGGVSLQEDTATLTVQAGETDQALSAAFSNIDTSTCKYLIVRTTEIVGGHWTAYIQRSDNDAWVLVASESEVGRKVVDLTEYYSGNIKGLALYAADSPDDSVTFDYAIICESYVFPPSDDVTDQLTVARTLINNEASGAQITLTNSLDEGDTYIDLKEYGYGIIWASRDPETLHDTGQKLFGGRIASITQDSQIYGETKVTITFHGHASELFDSPELVYKLYGGEYGDTIIEDALDLMNYLAKYPHAVGWFDGGHGGSQIGTVDDRITSTHSVELDEIKPLDVIQEILEKASGPGGTSFDAYETPSGALVGHLRNSADWTCPVTPTFQTKKKVYDFHRVINKQKVYGANGKEIPSDEAWTESTDGWTTDTGSLSLTSLEGTPPQYTPKSGKYMLKCTYDNHDGKFRRDISSIFYGFGKRRHSFLYFWRLLYDNAFLGASTGRVELWAPDESNQFWVGIDIGSGKGWKEISRQLGEDAEAEDEESPATKWQKIGSPSWANVQQICFHIEDDNNRFGMCIDDLKFGGAPYSATVEDATSKGKYGTREAEPVIDQTLLSDAECTKKATEVIEAKKNPPTTIEPFTVDGDARYKPGDILSDNGDSYRIIKVEHSLAGSQWDAKLTVSEVL